MKKYSSDTNLTIVVIVCILLLLLSVTLFRYQLKEIKIIALWLMNRCGL